MSENLPAVPRTEVSTQLAMARTYLADERTLMAWLRTSLSMISFGFTIGKLGNVLQAVEIKGPLRKVRTLSIEPGLLSVVLGTLALLAATVQHWRRIRRLHAMGLDRRFRLTVIVALAVAAVGGFALTSLVLSV